MWEMITTVATDGVGATVRAAAILVVVAGCVVAIRWRPRGGRRQSADG
jgi:hypothetical protein